MNIRSESACSIYFSSESASYITDSKPAATITYFKYAGSIKYTRPASSSSYDNKLQSSYNFGHVLDYVIPNVYANRVLYLINVCKPDSIKKLVEISKEQNIDWDQIFQEQGKIFFTNC